VIALLGAYYNDERARENFVLKKTNSNLKKSNCEVLEMMNKRIVISQSDTILHKNEAFKRRFIENEEKFTFND
jgi:predicted nucleotidyltransferase